MKNIWKWLLGLVVGMGLGSVRAQNCWVPDSANARLAPSFLALMAGNYPQPRTGIWETFAKGSPQHRVFSHAMQLLENGKGAPALDTLNAYFAAQGPDSLLDTVGRLDRVLYLEAAALAAMVAGKWDQSHAWAQRALQFKDLDFICRLKVEPLVASYLKAYGATAPLFPHFNGGFYNYVSDSLHWGEKANPDDYAVALNTVALLYRWDKDRQPLYLELMGDLLSKEPSRFNANYLAGLAYMRAGQIAGGKAQEQFDRKAIFALEAPRQAEERFNQYRFTQLKKALQADVDSAATWAAKWEAGPVLSPLTHHGGLFTLQLSTAAFFEDDPGQLPGILAKSKSQLAARQAEAKRYAGDVDLKKEVKKDSRFNSYALILIFTIVAAVVFIWVKLRRASRS